MLIGFFKSKFTFQPVIVIGFSFLLCFYDFIHPFTQKYIFESLPFINQFFTGFSRFTTISLVLGFVMLIINAFLFNLIITSNNLMGKHTYLPALLYVLLFCLFRNSIVFNQLSFVNLFLLLITRLLFKIFDKTDPYQQIIQIGMLLAFLSFFYIHGIIFIAFIWLVFIQFNIFSWREWVIIIIGVCIPYAFLIFAYFWVNRLPELTNLWITTFKTIHISLNVTTNQYILWGTLMVVSLLSLLYTINGLERNTVIIRKKFILFVSLLVTTLGAGMLHKEPFISLTLAMMPASLFAANYFQIEKKKIRREIIFIILLLLFVFSRIFIPAN